MGAVTQASGVPEKSKLRTILLGQRNRIGRRLIILIIAFSSLITLAISAVELISEYRVLRNGLHRDLDELNIYVPSISGSVWDFDEKQIQLSLNALALLSNIDQVSVTASHDRKTWTAGHARSSNTVTRTYPLMHVSGNRQEQIGTFKVVASMSAIHRQVLERALTIILSNGLKTFLVAIFMTMLFRRLVTGRLEALGRKAATLTPKMFDLKAADVPDTASPPVHMDELDAVGWTLDRTGKDLDMMFNTLQVLNEELRFRLSEQDALVQNALVGILMVSHSHITSCNPRFEEIFGYQRGALTGRPISTLYSSEEESRAIRQRILAALAEGRNFSDTLLMVKADGTRFWAEVTGRAIDPDHFDKGSIWILADVTERKRAEEKIAHIAYHDALTGLPNRLLFEDRFGQAIAHAQREHGKIALLFLDLDNFKTINDTLGHGAGDTLIKLVAERLSGCVRQSDIVSRQGGDEFLIMLTSLHEPNAAAAIIGKMMEQLLAPFAVDGHDLNTSVSIGAAVYPDDGADFNQLMKKADMAMYRAKDAGRNTYRFFDEQMNIEAQEQLNIRTGLRRALTRGEFLLHYQPQIDLASGAMVGVEALLRWQHPELGLVPPGRFIPVAEESGLIVPIGEWVLREACRQAAEWQKSGIRDFTIAINLSAVQFKNGDIERSLIGALAEFGVSPALLELELTESILIRDTESMLATIKRLKVLGFKLSIDDFGTGYSSLAYLKRFQVNKLKIDQSFVRDLATDPEDAAIVRTIVQIAKSFGLTTIAEGVEDEPTLRLLKDFGCDEGQGYLFARPMPAKDLTRNAAFALKLNSGTCTT